MDLRTSATGSLNLILLLAAVARADEQPKKSADVVDVIVVQGTLAEGYDYFNMTLKIAKEWCIYANPVGSNDLADSATVIELLIDGKPSKSFSVNYPKGALRKDAAGKAYRVYEGEISFTGSVLFAETQNAEAIAARVKVTASRGEHRLPSSVLYAPVE